MDSRIITLAAAVLKQADRAHPADAVLRAELKRHQWMTPTLARAAAEAVFAYYRWLGWLDRANPVHARLAKALALDEQFTREPDRFADAELLARAVPGWPGAEMEVTSQWLRTLQQHPVLWVRARSSTGATLAKQLGSARVFGSGRWSDTLAYEGATDLFHTPQFQAGAFEVQDIHSQAVSLLCDPQPGQTWWDACAGEGGKTLHLSALMGNSGLIWASDRAAWRLAKLKRRAGRAEVFNYRSAAWDGGPRLPTRTRFDGVLVDAPCSGIGTWQRNPHARWTATAQDVRELAKIQVDLLAHAAPALKPGGRLVYSVCTPTRAETVDVAKTFSERFPELEPLPLPDIFSGAAGASKHIWLRTEDRGGNGMFVCAWRRK